MIPGAGTLKIALIRRDGAVAVSVTQPAVPPLAQIFQDRPAEEVAHRVPLIFNICAAAQEAAVRSALDLPVSADLTARIAAECLREHVLKLCIVWPDAMGLSVGHEALPLVGAALTHSEAARGLARAIFDPLETVPASTDEFETWMQAGRTAAARTFAVLAREWDTAWGRADLPLLDTVTPVDWDHASQNGGPVENAPACRHPDSSLLAGVGAKWGHGPLWRMAARLTEVAALLGGDGPDALAGRGVANAARGAMMVDAAAGPSGITRFRRLSPTEFALAPKGVLETALATLPLAADAPLRTVAQMIVETVDPCVATELEVSDA